ncbi:protein regulator of cytokinesis 1-like [Saccoglossus kowalevskii]
MATSRSLECAGISDLLEDTLGKLHGIWEEIGIGIAQQEERQKVVLHHLRALLEEMVNEEEEMRQRLLKSVESCSKELASLTHELALPLYEAPEHLTILQLEKELRTRVDVLNKEKHERLKKLSELKSREQHLCDILCATPYYVPTGSIPSNEQNSGYNIFTKTKQDILDILEDLEQSPNTSFERDIVCEEEDSFLLSAENMDALKSLHTELQDKKKETYYLRDRLRDRIQTLYDRLLVDKLEQNKFFTEAVGYKPKVIEALRAEIARLEELKRQNIHKVIEGIRQELLIWWDKCYFSRQQRHDFTAAYEGFKKANDPNRFANRGGNLLQEEKTRKRLQKELPKVEKELGARISQWEQEKCKNFLVHGCPFMDYVQAQWAAHKTKKKVTKESKS